MLEEVHPKKARLSEMKSHSSRMVKHTQIRRETSSRKKYKNPRVLLKACSSKIEKISFFPYLYLNLN